MLAFTASLPLSQRNAFATVKKHPLSSPVVVSKNKLATNNNKNGVQMVLSDRESKRTPERASSTSNPALNEPPAMNPKTVQTPSLSKKDNKQNKVAFRITGNNISITESLRLHVTEKLEKVTKRYDSLLTKIDVHLTVEQNPSIQNKNKAEVVAFAGKTILRTEIRSDDMYGSIDLVQQRIIRIIRKYKERRDAKFHNKTSISSTSNNQLNFIDQEKDLSDTNIKDVYEDMAKEPNEVLPPGIPPVNEVIRRKVFPMPLQTVEEAVLCCEYVDHPWYLFRNAESNEICLVYKRNHGGYGLIEPSNPNGASRMLTLVWDKPPVDTDQLDMLRYH